MPGRNGTGPPWPGAGGGGRRGWCRSSLTGTALTRTLFVQGCRLVLGMAIPAVVAAVQHLVSRRAARLQHRQTVPGFNSSQRTMKETAYTILDK